MARRTQKISFVERIRAWRNARAKQPGLRDWNWVAIVKVMAVIGFLAGSGAFLRYAEAYVKTITPVEEGSLVLVAVPGWADCNLRERVAEVAGGKRFPLTEETAVAVGPQPGVDGLAARRRCPGDPQLGAGQGPVA